MELTIASLNDKEINIRLTSRIFDVYEKLKSKWRKYETIFWILPGRQSWEHGKRRTPVTVRSDWTNRCCRWTDNSRTSLEVKNQKIR